MSTESLIHGLLCGLTIVLLSWVRERFHGHFNRVLFVALNGGKAPTRATEGAAGFDCYAREVRRVFPYSVVKIPLGFACAIPKGHVGIMALRSGVASKGLLSAPGGIGVIDSDYRGEVCALVAAGEAEVVVGAGERICQIVVVPCVTGSSTVDVPSALGETVRGTGGFGSTGVA
jgi:dUTP pyrophosphatase